ncbi:MAG TPA: hypothetical protein VM307_03620 [Egibacteraceae bacterium]|nr:hypothetical protein [Egibacteraceae bacterium]
MTWAMTVHQPWASLIVAGAKDVENRTWPIPSTLARRRVCSSCGDDLERVNVTGVRLHEHAGRWFDWVDVGPAPFRLAIHASRTYDHAAVLTRRVHDAILRLDHQPAERMGALLGHVTVTGSHHADDCVINHRYPQDDAPTKVYCSPWAEPDAWHWKLTDPERLPAPIPMRGRQRMWRLPADIRLVAA